LGPKDFDIVINLQTPFLYDPSASNLLLDVRIFAGENTTQFDAEDSIDAVSRVISITSTGVDDATGAIDSIGLVTQFTMTSVANTPQSTDNCMHGGWRTRTRSDGSTFKSQGDCIQYVTKGK